MADIFVSYAQADREWVKELATALEAEGLSVWWDPNLLPGTKFRDAIQSEMNKAKAVVVVWSLLAIESDWVRDEAEDGRQLRKLVPVLKDPVTPPHGFRQLQTANLSQWRGRRENPEFRMLVRGIRALTGENAGAPANPPANPPVSPPAGKIVADAAPAASDIVPDATGKSAPAVLPPNRKRLAIGTAAALLLVAGGAAMVFHGMPSREPAAPAANATNQEDELWDSVKNSDDPAVIQTYLSHYPAGLFAETARAKIAALNKAAQAPAANPAPSVPQGKPAPEAFQTAKPAPPRSAAPMPASPAPLNAQVSQAVDAARAAEKQARDLAAQARDVQGQAETAMQQAEQAAQRAEMGTAGYGALTGPTKDGGTFRWVGQVVGRAPGSLGVFSVTGGALSGNRYEGEVRNNVGNGVGVNIRATGLRYEGDERDGQYGDYGVLTFPNGDRYEGKFENADPAFGIYTGNASATYREKAGQLANLKLNGYGVVSEKDGSSKAGAFKDDQLSGYGAVFDAKGQVTQQGTFVAGTLTAPASPSRAAPAAAPHPAPDDDDPIGSGGFITPPSK
jgi:hypothetical protein